MPGRGQTAGVVLPALLGALALGAPVASAQEQITASAPNQYVTTDVTIDQGERVTFTNTDVAEHDVVARDRGADDKPLFRSELTSLGGSVPVEGTEYLSTGNYRFFCSLHPQMEGLLRVSSAGKPLTRPTPGGGGPSLRLEVLDRRLADVRRRGALRVRLRAGAAAAVGMRARANGKTFAKASARLGRGATKTVRLKLTRAGRRMVRRARRVTVTVTATARSDSGSTTKTARKTLRR